jgi:hypothetical protein
MAKIGLALGPGLTSINTSYSNVEQLDGSTSTSGSWMTGDKVRFYQQGAQVIGGWEAMSATTITGMCRNTTSWKDNAGASCTAFGTHSNLYLFRSGSMMDITPVGFSPGNINGEVGPGFGVGGFGKGPFGLYTDVGNYWPQTWSLDDFGQSLIASPRGGPIYWWQNVLGSVAAPLSASVAKGKTDYTPQQNTYVLVTPQRQLMSFGTNQQYADDGVTAPGPYNPLLVRWSDVDGNITDWDEADPDALAGEFTLPSGGNIVGARVWGQLIAIWTQDALYTAQYTGDSDTVWDFTQVDGSVGLLNPNACVVVGASIFWVSPDLQVWSAITSAPPQQFDCPIRADTLDQIKAAQTGKVVMSYSSASDEVRIDYPDQRDGLENSRYLTLYLDDGTSWSQGQLARTTYDRAAALQWPVGVAPMDESGQSTVYFHEIGNTADDGNISWSIQTNDFCMDEDQTTMMVRGIWPDFKGQQGDVQLTLYARTNPQDTPVAYGPYTLAPGVGKVDLRVTGRLFSIEFSGCSSPASCRIGRPVFDVVSAGTR